MAEKNAFNSINKDSMDINELASLNDDISPELIDQLQQKLTQDAQSMGEEKASKISPNFDVNDDTTLFEEPQVNETNTQEPQKPEHTSEKKGFNLDKNFDDNFIKKYKAKLNKQQETGGKDKKEEPEDTISSAAFSSTIDNSENIEQITKGNMHFELVDLEERGKIFGAWEGIRGNGTYKFNPEVTRAYLRHVVFHELTHCVTPDQGYLGKYAPQTSKFRIKKRVKKENEDEQENENVKTKDIISNKFGQIIRELMAEIVACELSAVIKKEPK